jgi:hypothetical protein
LTPTYSEVFYETQSSLVMHERPCARRLLQAAVDIARPGRFNHDGTSCSGGLQLDLEHASGGSVEPVHNTAARQQW